MSGIVSLRVAALCGSALGSGYATVGRRVHESETTCAESRDAKERSAKAKVAWEQFHQTYQAAHPNVPGLRFTDDFSLAFALMSSSVDEVRQVTIIELTAEEKRKLDSLHREVTESEQSRRQAERNWRDYQHQRMADHAGNSSTGSGAIVELANGKQVLIPYPWASGLTFTTDFRLAFPLTF